MIQAWLDQRLSSKIDREIDLIRVYQFKMPDGIGPLDGGPWPQTWWDAFWDGLDLATDERDEFIRNWVERNADGGYQLSFDECFAVDPESHDYFRAGQQTIESY